MSVEGGGPPLRLTALSNIDGQTVEWLVPKRVPLGHLTILEGPSGTGKSTVLADWAARVSTGAPLLGDDPESAFDPQCVLILSAEDHPATTLRPRVAAAGADLNRIFIESSTFVLEDNLSRLGEAIEQTRALLVIIDPIAAYLGDTNMGRDAAMRRVLQALAALAERHGVAIILVRHLIKSTSVSSDNRGVGAVAIGAVVRSVLRVVQDPTEEDQRVLLNIKNNLARKARPFSFRLVDDTTGGMARIDWIGEVDDVLIDVGTNPSVVAPARGRAIAFLEALLSNGPVLQRHAEALARVAGISDRTLERAKESLGIKPKRAGFGPGSHFWWSLPTNGTEPDEPPEPDGPLPSGTPPSSAAETEATESSHSVPLDVTINPDGYSSYHTASSESIGRHATVGDQCDSPGVIMPASALVRIPSPRRLNRYLVEVPSIQPIQPSPGFEKKMLSEWHLELLARCGFACRYCSSPDGNYERIHRQEFLGLAEEHFGKRFKAKDPSVMYVWPDLIPRLRAQVDSHRPTWGSGKTLMLSMLTDAFSPWLINNGILQEALKLLLQRTSFRIRVLTKNAVVGSAEWATFFQAHRDRFVVGLSIGSLDERWTKRVELGTSSPSQRLDALANLQKAGVPTFGMLCPIFPDAMEGDGLEKLVQLTNPAVVEHLWAEPYNDRNNWQAVQKGYPPDSFGYRWFESVFADGRKEVWSRYAAEQYTRLRAMAEKDGWMHKLRYLLYEKDIEESDAPAFSDLQGVLLQTKPLNGRSSNKAIAKLQTPRTP